MSQYEDASFEQHLVAEIQKRDAQIADLERQIEELKQQKGISGASEGLTFNERTGTHLDASAKHFCTKCLLKDNKRIPLKNEPHGWRCMICTKYYADPNRPQGPIEYGDSWMA